MIEVAEALQLRRIAVHFQRSINLTYDSGNASYVSGYVPTANGARVLARILRNGMGRRAQKAYVLHGPYGSGKSLLSLVLVAFASSDPIYKSALDLVQDRLERHFPDSGKQVASYRKKRGKLLPVLLSGDNGPLRESLMRALVLAINQLGLGDLRPRTRYSSALSTIEMWEKLYPEVQEKLLAVLMESGFSLDELIDGLNKHKPDALSLFEELYPILAAGARFDGYTGATLADSFHETALALHEVGYDGIIVIWDEFGRFMEARANQAFGQEAEQLQNFAEFCNRSGNAQVQLVLVTHRQITTYASGLPEHFQKEWARIAKRFHEYDVTSNPATTYHLIAEALEVTNTVEWKAFLSSQNENFDQLTRNTSYYGLFGAVDETVLRKEIIEQVWPLHPLTVFALPRLSREVAQNERTLFTFLASDDDHGFKSIIREQQDSYFLVTVDALWDYFADGIRNENRTGGAHATWSGVMYALSKVEFNSILAKRIVKALGVLTIVGASSLQNEEITDKVIPSTELLAWSTNAPVKDVEMCLKKLSRQRAVMLRRADGFWTFTRGSDIDLEAEVVNLISQQSPTKLQLRQLLQSDAPLPIHYPRGYNLAHAMTRYFLSIYRWPNELEGIGSEIFLDHLDKKGHADGVVVYVLVTNSVERDSALDIVRQLPPNRAVFVIPERPLLIDGPLYELFALRDLRRNPQFMSQDERLDNEIEFFINDNKRQLERRLEPFLRPQLREARWVSHDGNQWRVKLISNQVHVSRLLTGICYYWFTDTPVLNNESLNLHRPTKIQVRASERVIDLLLKHAKDGSYPFDLGMVGYGPDRLILRTLLVRTGLLKPTEDIEGFHDASEHWQVVEPSDDALARVWGIVQDYLNKAREEEQDISGLVTALQLPPFGLRRGVLPVLLAATMQSRLSVLTVRLMGLAISPITGRTFTELCYKPDGFTFEVGEWDERREALWGVLEGVVSQLLAVHELEHQPLNYLSLGLLRWLQSLPRYCRDTSTISDEASQLRQLIRLAQHEPAQVLLHDLLDLLDDGQFEAEPGIRYREYLSERLSQLMSQISGSYQQLLYSLDHYVEERFASNSAKRHREGQAALRFWLSPIERNIEGGIKGFRFSDNHVQRFVDAIRIDVAPGRFWDVLARALIGLEPSDWNDRSVEAFKVSLLDARERLQKELFEITEDEEVIELGINFPHEGVHKYRFRTTTLSNQGKHILENFKTTMAIAGRPLSPDERRQVALAFLSFIMEGDQGGLERKNKSLRIQR